MKELNDFAGFIAELVAEDLQEQVADDCSVCLRPKNTVVILQPTSSSWRVFNVAFSSNAGRDLCQVAEVGDIHLIGERIWGGYDDPRLIPEVYAHLKKLGVRFGQRKAA